VVVVPAAGKQWRRAALDEARAQIECNTQDLQGAVSNAVGVISLTTGTASWDYDLSTRDLARESADNCYDRFQPRHGTEGVRWFDERLRVEGG
jgi:hypothetical protein